MGGADVYCCLCGGPLSPPYWEVDENTEDTAIDGEDTPDDNSQKSGGSEVDEEVEATGDDLDENAGEADEDTEEEGAEYDPKIVRPDDDVMDWLRDVRLVCENLNSPRPMQRVP